MPKRPVPFVEALEVSSDDRGTFSVFFTNRKNPKYGPGIKRVYYVYNYGRGVVRGFHYHKKEWKYFTAVAGVAKVIAVDPDNPETKYVFVSSPRKPTLIVIPPGYANGWMSLEDDTVLVCGSSSTTQESIKDDKRIDPYSWGDIWTVKGR